MPTLIKSLNDLDQLNELPEAWSQKTKSIVFHTMQKLLPEFIECLNQEELKGSDFHMVGLTVAQSFVISAMGYIHHQLDQSKEHKLNDAKNVAHHIYESYKAILETADQEIH